MAAVAIQGSTHYGAGQYWTNLLAKKGVAAILTSTTGPVAAPYGGSEAMLGTNPLTLSLPSTGSALFADLATTAGAYGKVVAARNEGSTIPEGWGVDAEARPTTDPAAVLDGGALLPLGGHKGSGISVLLEGFAAALTGASYAFDTVDMWIDRSSRMNTGHLLVAFDLAAFGDEDAARAKTARLQERVRAARPGGVVAPGDIETRNLERSGDTVTLAPSTVEALVALGRAHGLEAPAPLS